MFLVHVKEIVDPGLSHAAAEQKNDEQILLQIREKNCVTLEVPYHKICDNHYTKICARVEMHGLRNEKYYHYIILYICNYKFCVTDITDLWCLTSSATQLSAIYSSLFCSTAARNKLASMD